MTTLRWNDREVMGEVEGKVVKALRRAGRAVLRSARPEVPVGDETRSPYRRGPYAGQSWTARFPGTLKKSGRVRITKNKKRVQVIFGSKTAYYGRFVEFGVVKRGRPIAGRLYLKRGFEKARGAVLDAFDMP